MTFTELYQNYLGLLWSAFQYDIEVFSQWWMYSHLLIPASAYLGFFIVKWIVLLFPVWGTVAMPLYFIGNMAEYFVKLRESHIKKQVNDLSKNDKPDKPK